MALKKLLKRVRSHILRHPNAYEAKGAALITASQCVSNSDCFYLEYHEAGKLIQPTIKNPESRFVVLPQGRLSTCTAIRLLNGESIQTSPVLLSREHVLELSLSVPDARQFEVEVIVTRVGDGALHAAYLLSPANHSQHRTFVIGLQHIAGEHAAFSIKIQAPQGVQATVDLLRLAVYRRDQLSRINALANYEWRLKNEIAHFSGAYTHSMYQKDTSDNDPTKGTAIEKQSEPGRDQRRNHFLQEQDHKVRAKMADVLPIPGESVFGFAQRCLGTIIPLSSPDFFARAAHLSQSRSKPLRMLSLCAGAARIEEDILKHCRGSVELTLLDASEELMKKAASRFTETGHEVRCILGDINKGLPSTDSFDVIICVSALHHVVDLERVVSQINECLSESGEFWSIGEQIGRNGNRLWPDALEAANAAFTKLPAAYRKNAHTRQIDEVVPDDDFSLSCFEGIRSEEIETMLENYLIPVDVYKRNCFLWRLTDTTYCDNFDLSVPEDLNHLRELVVAEALHWVSGGKGTELHGVYRKKQF
jgi:ubiquinone/menaquinone biosynthesis C-methylase UbiE